MSQSVERVIEYDRPTCPACFGERCERCQAAKPRRLNHFYATADVALCDMFRRLKVGALLTLLLREYEATR